MAVATYRVPTAGDFVRLKLRLLRNGFRGQTWRVVGFVFGLLLGLWLSALAVLGLSASGAASRDFGFMVAAFAGTVVVLGWTLVPLLFFGVDETLDPARFALLPLRPMTLARGMLAAAFVGVPAVATFLATSGLVIAAAIRFGAVAAVVALVGVIGGLFLGVVASRAVTSAFAGLLRSRRVRDLAAVIIALLASSVGPLQWALTAAINQGSLDQALRVANVLAWTPLGAPYVLPYDVAEGRWVAAGVRFAMTVGSAALLLWWWSRTLESAMLGATSGGAAKAVKAVGTGAVSALLPRALRGIARPNPFGAILARESRFWWRDPRRRASLVSIMMASAVVPIALNFASNSGEVGRTSGLSGIGFSFAVTMSGTMGGMLLANQFAFDGSAFATHLLTGVPGKVELRARAVAIGLVAVPVQLVVVIAVTFLAGTPSRLPAGLGMLAASFGSAVAAAGVLSVLAPYALPENTNPFAMNSGGGSAKGLLAFVAMIGTLIISAPVVVAAFWLGFAAVGAWVVLGLGLVYGVAAAWLGTYIAGDLLERRAPEILIAVTPRR
jgi:ABC-2 type transport system permease protein